MKKFYTVFVLIVVGMLLLPTVALAETVAPSAEVEVISPAHYAGEAVPQGRALYARRYPYTHSGPKSRVVYRYGYAIAGQWKYTGVTKNTNTLRGGRAVVTYQVTKINCFGTKIYSMTIR